MITIKEKEYNVKVTIRSMFIFEQITGKSFSINTTLDNYIYLYSILLASNKDMQLTFDEFVDATDEDPNILIAIKDTLEAANKISD